MHDTSFGAYNQAPIYVLFLSHPTHTKTLQQQLGHRYVVLSCPHEPDEALLNQADMAVVDGPRCLAHHQFLRARKARLGAMALPLLLLTTQETTYEREQAFADIIDDTVMMPADPRVLLLRIQALLQTQRLHEENDRLLKAQAKHVEALLREREIRSRFVAAISHDLRIPLTSTQMAADMLLRGSALTDKQRKYVCRITSSVERMDAMIHTILDANQLQQHQSTPLHPIAGDLGAMVQAALDDWREQHPTRFGPMEHLTVQGYWDTHAIRRALDNLINNALKYGEPRTLIEVGFHFDPTTQTATLDVRNQGAAIADAQQHRLFELFHRTPSAVAGNQQGWGIGLAVVRGIAHAHGGEVGVESAADTGTRFYMSVVSHSPT